MPVTASPTLDKVQVLQRTLYRAAKADPGRRFHALYDKVYRRDVLVRAWVLVRQNDGAPGIDKQTIAMAEKQYGVTRLLDELAADLKAETYRPLAARRVYIPKPGLSDKRPLSIPVESDIASCFEAIPHHQLMQAVEEQMSFLRRSSWRSATVWRKRATIVSSSATRSSRRTPPC